jgi:hypothetical protein
MEQARAFEMSGEWIQKEIQNKNATIPLAGQISPLAPCFSLEFFEQK